LQSKSAPVALQFMIVIPQQRKSSEYNIMGKAQARRIKWLQKKDDFDNGVAFLMNGSWTKKCSSCGSLSLLRCEDCHTWHCTNGNCTEGRYCECY